MNAVTVLRWLLLVFFMNGAVPRSSLAQSDAGGDRAAARALFDQGLSHADAGRMVEAADCFRRALDLKASPVIAFNLASALEATSRLVEASEHLRSVAHDPAADRELRAEAEAAIARIEPRIGKLTVRVEGDAADTAVTLDGRALQPAEIGTSIPVDPGSHELTLRRGEDELSRKQVDVAEGGLHEVTLAAASVPSPAAVALAAVDSAPAEPDYTESPQPITSKWWFWTATGVVAAGAVVAVVVLASGGDPSAQSPFGGDFDPGSVTVEVQR